MAAIDNEGPRIERHATPADKPDLPEGTPERIYLQISNDDAEEQPVTRFQDLGEVTWCEDPIGAADPAYIRADVVRRLLADERRKARAEMRAELKPVAKVVSTVDADGDASLRAAWLGTPPERGVLLAVIPNKD